jgi:hypothetical protein
MKFSIAYLTKEEEEKKKEKKTHGCTVAYRSNSKQQKRAIKT